tara:strand:+ start:1126 stop:1476 length:351 start_codon:yes stop_codon:yes gene_type:complete
MGRKSKRLRLKLFHERKANNKTEYTEPTDIIENSVKIQEFESKDIILDEKEVTLNESPFKLEEEKPPTQEIKAALKKVVKKTQTKPKLTSVAKPKAKAKPKTKSKTKRKPKPNISG